MQAYVRVNLSEKETSVKRSERRLERVRAMKRSFGKIFLAVLAMVAYASRLVHKRLRQDLFECLFSFFFFFGFVFFETGLLYAALVILEVCKIRGTSKSEIC